jgi:hypothetical protein
MNSFIHTVGKQNLGALELEKAGHIRFDWFALGIPSERLQIQRFHTSQHSRRAADRALVEIKSQASSVRQRRPIGT